jgi:hypothetical protein
MAPLFFCPDLAHAAEYWRGVTLRPWLSGDGGLEALLGLFLVGFFVFQAAGRAGWLHVLWSRAPSPVRAAAAVILCYTLLFGAVPAAERFIYTRF